MKKLLAANGETVPFIAYLKEQADISAAIAGGSPAIGTQSEPDPLTKRQIIVDTLQQTARQSQAGVLQMLSGPGLSGQSHGATEINSLWIVNAVAAKGTLNTVLALAARPDVEVVRLDKTISIVESGFSAVSDFFANTPNSAINNQQLYEWGISKIRADVVQNALEIDGAGVVVANIDSGVDWGHPDLQAQYRGYTGAGKLPLHTGNWFDATGDGALYPVDANGHGTHTMGTSVGQNGIGVAPGARWIAARAFDAGGNGRNSWIHSAFQWVLAPNGEPALAPDIVNNSWSSSNGASTEFQTDVQMLLDAGIYPVFAAGNNGPSEGTVGSPASFNISFSVGATDINDDVALFSGRGPSPWGKTKPEISAPGRNVRSALPGGTYGNLSGTSMAAPHVTGVAAMLLQASPALSANLSNISHAITTTAIPLDSPVPNNNYGWGRVDAYNAVMSVVSAGAIQGIITNATTGNPVPDASVQIIPGLGGVAVNTTSSISGTYLQGLTAGAYNVTASAFGYNTETANLVDIITGATTIQNFSLLPQPDGTLAGLVTDNASGQPLTATITVQGTPVSTRTVNGAYSLQLPVGVYTVTAMADRHRITSAVNVNIEAGSTTTKDFALDSGPSILLVDSGKWYQESQLSFYRQALEDALYTYDVWQISQPFDTPGDVPAETVLSEYDIVVWSAPYDSPGYIGADAAIVAYLQNGGNLLLSGQDIAYFDGGGGLGSSPYFAAYLKAAYVQDTAGIDTVAGQPGTPFDGMSLTISGGDGANNQTSPDVIAVADDDFAGPILVYTGTNNLAGLYVGQCLAYNAVYLPFGLEGINSRAGRSEVISRTVDWLLQPPAPTGIELSPAVDTRVGNFGAVVTHTIRVRNTGATADTISLNRANIGPHNWPVGAVPPSVWLPSCASQNISVTVEVPLAKTYHITDTFTVAAQSGNNPAFTALITRNTKTPAPVLLVDDDRWYSFANQYKAALAANNIEYDYWYVPKSWSGASPPSPPLDVLQMYPMAVWYTAYDWFQPLTIEEEERLMAWLDGGGRLFFSSQDFLFRHLDNHSGEYGPFATEYLGVPAHTEDYSSTLTVGNNENPAGAFLGPYALTFPSGYRNWTDALTPTASAEIFSRGQAAQPNGLTHAGVASGGQQWHTNFLAYGPELLASGNRARLMQRSLGWLSWLGSSTVDASALSVAVGDTISYSAVISNNGLHAISTAHFTATFPAYLTPGAASSNLSAGGGMFTWAGPLAVNESQLFTYTAQINQPLTTGTVISQTNWLAYSEHNILFDRVAAVAVAPNLGGSLMTVFPNHNIEQNDTLTYTIVLKNKGTVGSSLVTTTNTLPDMLTLLGVNSPGGAVVSNSRGFTWTTPLAKDEMMTLTFRVSVTAAGGGIIGNVAYVADGVNETVALVSQAAYRTVPTYLPIIVKNR